MRIVFHDVGRGGCSVVTCPNGARIMLDCGYRADPAWFPSVTYRDRHVNVLVFTNLDEDHVEDLPYVWDRIPIGSIFSNPTVTAQALASMKRFGGAGQGVSKVGHILNVFGPGLIGAPQDLGVVRAWAYWNRYGTDFKDTNNLSVASFIRFGSFTILFAGDLETAGWKALLRVPGFAVDLATVTVLVASHHGRVNGQCAEVFQFARPEIVVFSDDRKQYESQETDAWYRQRVRGVPVADSYDPLTGYARRHVYTTRRDGTITIEVDNASRYLIAPERTTSSPTSPLSLLGVPMTPKLPHRSWLSG